MRSPTPPPIIIDVLIHHMEKPIMPPATSASATGMLYTASTTLPACTFWPLDTMSTALTDHHSHPSGAPTNGIAHSTVAPAL